MLRYRAPLVLAIVVLAASWIPAARAATIVAVTNDVPPKVVTFDSATPGTFATSVNVSGLGATEDPIGVDFNPNDGLIYCLTRDSGGVGRLHTLDPMTGALTFRATLSADPADLTSPYSTIPNQGVDIDVNPVANRIRVSSGQSSWRVNPVNGFVTTDSDFTVVNGAVAYTNSFAGATATTLYGYDYLGDVLGIVNPPNNGTFTAVGPSGFSSQVLEGMGLDVAGSGGTAYLAATTGGATNFYTQSLVTGAATLVGATSTSVGDLTVLPNFVSAPSSSVAASEGAGGSAIISLRRAQTTGSATIEWTVTPGTAAAADIATLSGTVTFAPGDSSRNIAIPIVDDAVDENEEAFSVVLTANTDPALLSGTVRTVIVTVGDNDVTPPPVVTPPVVTPPVVAPPVVVTPPPADTTAPFLFVLKPAATTLRSLGRSGLPTLFTASEAVTGVAQLRLGTRVVGTASFSSTRASLLSRRIKLTRTGAALLAKAKGPRVKLALVVTSKDAAGNPSAVVSRLVIVTK